MTILTTRPLADIVAENPAAARVFDRVGLDYCCHGDRTLGAACAEAGVDPAAIAGELAGLAPEGDTGWRDLDPTALADHIVATHHAYLRDELPLLEALADKVLSVHGERHPELATVRDLVVELRGDLEPHLDQEEKVLFPAVHALAARQEVDVATAVVAPIESMEGEHDAAGELLARLRAATGAFAVPADGCASYRSLYERLEELEHDVHLHVLKENAALFPAAVALARA